jgi:hypothetical protein
MLIHPLSRHAPYDPSDPSGAFREDGEDSFEPQPSKQQTEVRQSASEQPRRKRSLKRRIAIVAGIVLCVLLVVFGIAVGVMLFLTRDTASPYRLGQALEQFKLLQRRAGDGIVKTFTNLPVLGVYTYSTSGSESAKAPGLLSSASGYPSTTTMTVFSDRCGQDWRWQPLTNRYEDLVICRASDGALMLRSRLDDEEFYGVTDRRDFTCTAGSVFLPSRASTGQSLSGSCVNGGNKNSGGMTIAYSGKVVGDETVVVGGVGVPTVELAIDEKITGDTVGTGTVSIWLDRLDGLIVKETRTETTKSDSAVGWVPSSESFSLLLDSLTPKQ